MENSNVTIVSATTLEQAPIKNIFQFTMHCPLESYCNASVIVPQELINQLYKHASLSQKKKTTTHGFMQGNVPLEYVEQNFKHNLTEHLKEFLLKFCVIDYLYLQIRQHKITVSGEPRLTNITLEPNQDAHFNFELSLAPALAIQEWKYFPFKTPKRKNYKDLDRQVETFIKQERSSSEKLDDSYLLTVGDLVLFNISIASCEESPLLNSLLQQFWFKLGNEEFESPLRELFIGKKKGDIFYSKDITLLECFSSQLEIDYNFRVEIVDVLPEYFFCFDLFKNHFRIKTNKDMHKKLIEVFSFRNDQSQRRAIVEEALKLHLAKHPFYIPRSLILRQEKMLLDTIEHNPDYSVYRMQADFEKNIRALAEKQIRETAFIDQFAYHENIAVSNDDIKMYLNLLKRPRTKEFIYFKPPSSTLNGQEMPMAVEEIKRTGLREKAINHIIYHLTKK